MGYCEFLKAKGHPLCNEPTFLGYHVKIPGGFASVALCSVHNPSFNQEPKA